MGTAFLEPSHRRPIVCGVSDVWRLYDRYAYEFDRERGRGLMERVYLSEIAARLPPSAAILDIGCGAGEPIARFFIDRGFRLAGIDAAPSMIAICQERFPDAIWDVADMRSLALACRFDAVIAWDSFFHLTQDEQRAMFPVFRKHLNQDGLLLFTSGPEAGQAIGCFHGHDLHHASLDPGEYRALLASSGFRPLLYRAKDPDCGGHTVWLAQAIRQPGH
jgi:predicted TPR repeat methyltransferase